MGSTPEPHWVENGDRSRSNSLANPSAFEGGEAGLGTNALGDRSRSNSGKYFYTIIFF